jgi:hypothetical protein
MSGTAFAERCVDNGDGTVADNSTGLMWQKATAGEMSWDAARRYASGLSLGGRSGWRLPSRYALQGLYNSPCKDVMDATSLESEKSTGFIVNQADDSSFYKEWGAGNWMAVPLTMVNPYWEMYREKHTPFQL